MLKKFSKKDTVEEVIMKIPPRLTGGAFYYGKIKAGKTAAMMSLSQRYHDIFNYNIFDIHGGQRNENMYWGLPSAEVNYWDYVIKKFSINENQSGPKQYDVLFLYPMFASKIYKKLPHNPPFVKSRLFTIPIKSIDISDIKLVINSVSENSTYFWRECLDTLKKDDTAAELEEFVIKTKNEKTILNKNFLIPLIKEHFLQAETLTEYNLDIKNLMRSDNRKVIKVLCLDYIPSAYHLFIIGWILRQTKELLSLGKIQKRNLFIFREAGEYFRAKDDSVTDNTVKWFRKLLTDYVRYGRRGMHMFIDTQSPCLDKNTEILHYNNNKLESAKIYNLNKEIEILSYNFKKKITEKQKAKVIYIGEKNCYEIILENGTSVIATQNHRFFNTHNKEVFVKDLKVNDSIMIKDDK